MHSSIARLMASAALIATTAQLASAQCDVVNDDFTGLIGAPVSSIPGWTAFGGVAPIIALEPSTLSESIQLSGLATGGVTRSLASGMFETFRVRFDVNSEVTGLFQIDCPTAAVQRARILFDTAAPATVTSLTTGASLPMMTGALVPVEIEATIGGLVTISYGGQVLDQFPWSAGGTTCNSTSSISFLSGAGMGVFADFYVDNICVETEVGTPYCMAVPNTTGVAASMVAQGSDSIALNSLRLQTSSLPLNQLGYYIVAAGQVFIPTPGGSMGNLCVGGLIGRYNSVLINSGTSGQATMDLDLSANLPTPLSVGLFAGDTYNFQFWYRDWITGVGPANNFSNAVSLDFVN